MLSAGILKAEYLRAQSSQSRVSYVDMKISPEYGEAYAISSPRVSKTALLKLYPVLAVLAKNGNLPNCW